jgi:3-oxoacyl-[acyl-carrier protein] reductase
MAPSESKVAVITGSARPWGIGRAAGMALARKGYDIVIVDVRDERGEEGAASVAQETGHEAMYVHTDVSKRSEVFAMVDKVTERFGRIDVLINNAAIPGLSKTEDFTDEDFHRIIGVNLLGAMLCTQAVVPAMKARSYGRIVNVASSSPFQPPPPELSAALYIASKGGLIGWTKSAAVELAQYGIVVSAVAVGGLSTGIGSDGPATPEADEYMLNVVHRGMLPMGRLMSAEDAGDMVALVADAPNHGFLGATIHASGGRVMPL